MEGAAPGRAGGAGAAGRHRHGDTERGLQRAGGPGRGWARGWHRGFPGPVLLWGVRGRAARAGGMAGLREGPAGARGGLCPGPAGVTQVAVSVAVSVPTGAGLAVPLCPRGSLSPRCPRIPVCGL